jgi:hypothetical protein
MNRACRALGLLFLLFSMDTFVKAEDLSPVEGGEEIQAGNKIEWDPRSPATPAVGKLSATGTVTEAKGWTCTKVDVGVIDNATTKTIGGGKAALNNQAWTYTEIGLPSRKNVTVKATGTFTKGGMTETKDTVPAGLTIR